MVWHYIGIRIFIFTLAAHGSEPVSLPHDALDRRTSRWRSARYPTAIDFGKRRVGIAWLAALVGIGGIRHLIDLDVLAVI